MNVLFLTHSFPRFPGDSAGSFLLHLARALRAEDVRVRVVAPAEPGLETESTLDGVDVSRFHYAPRRYETLAYGGNMAQQVQASWSARFSLVGFLGAEFRCAYRQSRRLPFDLVHAHWWFPNGLVGSWIGSMSRTPLVTTMHGTDVRLVRTSAFTRPPFRHVVHHSAAVTTVSRWLADEARQLVSVPEPVVAPMPVATELFSPDGSRGRARDGLLFVGRLTPQKGLEFLVRALATMRHRVDLDVVGDGEDRAALEELARGMGVADRIRWHGALPQPRLAEFYRLAAALVVPSLEEGLGLVAVEGQLCETPVVAFASGGLPDVVQDGRTGVLVPPADSGALAKALDELLDRPDRGAALAAAGRLHALATFAPESVARRYAGIYQSAIASSPK